MIKYCKKCGSNVEENGGVCATCDNIIDKSKIKYRLVLKVLYYLQTFLTLSSIFTLLLTYTPKENNFRLYLYWGDMISFSIILITLNSIISIATLIVFMKVKKTLKILEFENYFILSGSYISLLLILFIVFNLFAGYY